MEWLVIIGYGFSLLVICLFSLGQFNLAWHYRKQGHKKSKTQSEPTELPIITVQLPIYNEKYVIERLIDAVASFDYPKEKLEIQVLDDSSDETIEIVAEKTKFYQSKGIDIKHIRRPDRVGYKAGALQFGLERAKGDLIAIFDADFVPAKDFLLKTIKGFEGEHVGMVQTRWGHLNEQYSWLTRMQAFGLNAHFTIEQKGRLKAGSFINFNGTAGIWRKECIQDAGGWQHDTLTEDLDLSYRAQLKGWKFEYIEEIQAPAELPVLIPAVKSQQYRWNKGAAETAKKNLAAILKSNIGFWHKVRATFHLLNSSVFVFLLTSAVLSIPMLYIKDGNPTLSLLFDLGSVFIIGFIAMSIFYWFAAKASNEGYEFKKFMVHFPMFLSYSMGLALHNSVAILEGYLGIKTPFIRTPKFAVNKKGESWKGNVYVKTSVTPLTLLEGLLALYFIYGLVSAFILGDYGLILFHLMLAFGFGYIFILSLKPIEQP